MSGSIASQKAVTLSLADLQGENVLFEALEEAFGPSSLGILIVKHLPSKFAHLRATVLSYTSYLANLSPEILDSLSSPEAKYLVGWSHGKEALKTGQYDTLKGSYYLNCAFYQDPSLQNAPADGFPNFPEYTAPNIWPPEFVLPGFKAAVSELCSLIIDTAVLVARACDLYASAHIEHYDAGYLERVVKTSLTTKARLLHYFPPEPSSTIGQTSNGTDDTSSEDSWCATHIDHGCLTGLTSALYINETLPLPVMSASASFVPRLEVLTSSPDPLAGLYIRSRTGTATKVDIPPDCLAFQTGEALEVITQGKFRAVPHFVRGPKVEGNIRLVRNTLAVFTQPNLEEVVDRENSTNFAEFAKGVVRRHTLEGPVVCDK